MNNVAGHLVVNVETCPNTGHKRVELSLADLQSLQCGLSEADNGASEQLPLTVSESEETDLFPTLSPEELDRFRFVMTLDPSIGGDQCKTGDFVSAAGAVAEGTRDEEENPAQPTFAWIERPL
jgi:hypothetical protein